MKRRTKLLIGITLLFIGFQSVFSQSGTYKPGEWFKFRIHYGIFNASYATLELKDAYLNGKWMYHAVGYGETTGLAKWFFKVEDTYESYFDKFDNKPYKFVRKIDEGGYTKDLEINFDHKGKEAEVVNNKNGKTKMIDFTHDVQDLISGFYYLRNTVKGDELKKDDYVEIDMLFDDDEVFTFKLKFLGKENIKTKFGKVECLRFRPYVQSGRVFKEKESLTLWVSNDDNKIPLRIQADLRVGSLKADLDAYKGLKNQFKIQF
ncbi:hypothetical protein NBRC110019_31090 [Neptunitalea chrysea]|uniref:DUF3108 domain-containing protein n=1 Tax=Neptunitalea chrysea TaxID=1647581 RepID=A0A9W6EWZ9_9FLAO|nr:DUF3108 domain-containing protein [Neptunitalea chrysea]GLB54068.1 hypothetical protein NBRC110019_31090 [Neptunitalea chrysea]